MPTHENKEATPAHELARFGFPLTNDQLVLREAIAAFANDRLAPGAAERDRSREYPKELIEEMAGLGLMGVKVAIDDGGAGADNVTYVLLMEAVARADASCAVVMAGTNLVSSVLADAASPEQKERFLRPLAEGERGAATFCLTEAHTGSDARAIRTTATRTDGGWSITGQKMWATSGAHAGLYLLFARTGEDGIGCFVVEPGTAGMEIGRDEQKMGQRSSGTVAIHFDGCVVPDSQLIGDPENGYRMALGSLTRGRIGIAALSIGLAEAALVEGLAYAREREAFGQRIVDFQNTQFVLAESRTELDAAWLLVLRAAYLFDRGQRARQEASMAKYWATEATGRVIDRMLQLHGGYGYSEEYAIERIYRDHRVTRIYEGTNEIQRLVIAREMLR